MKTKVTLKEKKIVQGIIIASELKKSDLFSSLSQKDLEKISSFCQIKTFWKNDIIFRNNKLYSGFYYIIEGFVKVFEVDGNCEERIIHIFHKGDTFADIPVFENIEDIRENKIYFPANATCLKNSSRLIFIPAKEFISEIITNHQMSFKLLSGLSKKLKLMQTQNFNLKYQDVRTRLLCFFLTNIESKKDLFTFTPNSTYDEIDLIISKIDLADYIGTTHETLSRTFRKLSKENILKVSGKKITIQK